MCSTGHFQFYVIEKDISIAHVSIIIRSEVSTFPIVIIFLRGCVPEMFFTEQNLLQNMICWQSRIIE